MAGELADADPVQEEIPMPKPEDTEGESPSVDERNAAPEPTIILHETPEDIESDKPSVYLSKAARTSTPTPHEVSTHGRHPRAPKRRQTARRRARKKRNPPPPEQR